MTKKLKIAIASDHAGFSLKKFLIENVKWVDWLNQGTDSDERVDYPDYAMKVAELVSEKKVDRGVLVCGTGIGMCISANKTAGVRAATAESQFAAKLSREHNDANILCLGSRILAPEFAQEILETWLKAEFEGGRHADRVKKISKLEK